MTEDTSTATTAARELLRERAEWHRYEASLHLSRAGQRAEDAETMQRQADEHRAAARAHATAAGMLSALIERQERDERPHADSSAALAAGAHLPGGADADADPYPFD